MAELSEAFNCFNNENKNFEDIDYFFTQRTMKENHEYFDKNMNRVNKSINIIYNFLAICIPTYNINDNKDFNYNIEIFGDSGYNYTGIIKSYNGIIPHFMIPLKGDKKVFIRVNYKENEEIDKKTKTYVCFVDVPKRFQTIDIGAVNLPAGTNTDKQAGEKVDKKVNEKVDKKVNEKVDKKVDKKVKK